MSLMLVSPYKNITQYSKIQIKPHQLNSDIKNYMKLELRKKVEKKCNKVGFIDEVYRIENYYESDMKPENLSGCCTFDVAFHCKICIPIVDTIIIAQIKAINQVLVLANNGPIMIFIPKENINETIWDSYDNFQHRKTKEQLKVNSYVKIEVVRSRINQLDYQIKVIGKLLDFADENEIKNYYGAIVEDTIEDDTVDLSNMKQNDAETIPIQEGGTIDDESNVFNWEEESDDDNFIISV